MVLSDEKIQNILLEKKITKDASNLVKYSDEIVIQARKEFGNILNRTSIIKILNDFKQSNKLKKSASVSKFIDIIIDKLGLFEPIKILNEYKGETVTRYIATDIQISPYEIALSLLSKSFLSHYSALFVNDLTINNPKDIYINKEQSKKDFYSNNEQNISQGRIDYAFSKKMRRTNMIYSFTFDETSYKVHVLNSKNTNNTGVVLKNVVGFSKPVRTTNIERTLIDATVRPGYSGGALEILEAFLRAKNELNSKQLWSYLKKFNYSYPYHKAIAFYLKYSDYSYKNELVDFCNNDNQNSLTFYLDYQMVSPQKDDELGIYFPKMIPKKW